MRYKTTANSSELYQFLIIIVMAGHIRSYWGDFATKTLTRLHYLFRFNARWSLSWLRRGRSFVRTVGTWCDRTDFKVGPTLLHHRLLLRGRCLEAG